MNIADETIEVACAAFYNDPSGLTSWERATKVSPEMAARYRAAMSRALVASSLQIAAGVWDEGQDAGANDQMAVDASLANGTPEPTQTPNPYRTAK